MPAARTTAPKTDTVLTAAVEVAHAAAERQAGDFGVGEYLGCEPEGERLLTHHFACPHHGYRGWRWAVTLTRAPRARTATVDEVVLVPGADALLAAEWVPWADRIRPGDVTPGTLLPTPDNDPRLEPGFTGGEMTEDDDPACGGHSNVVADQRGVDLPEPVYDTIGIDRALFD